MAHLLFAMFVASSVSGVEVLAIAKKAIPFLLFFLVALILITYIPALSLGLPSLMGLI